MKSRRLARQHWADYRERTATARSSQAPGASESGVVLPFPAPAAAYVVTGAEWPAEAGHSAFGPECREP